MSPNKRWQKSFTCYQCGATASRYTGSVNRAIRTGLKLFCSKRCFGLNRRVNRSIEDKKLIKRLYDIEYREKNRERLRQIKAAYFQKIYPEKAEHFRAYRKSRMAKHVEYCRQPEYRAKKHRYDRERYAKAKFGKYWESHCLIMDINDEVLRHMSKYDVRLKNQTYNKAQRRIRNGTTKRGYA